MKAPLSRSVPLACDLLALSKSSDAVNDNAGKKKKSKGYKQDGFDRPLSWTTGLYEGLSCDIVWLCVPLCKSRWWLLSVLEVVFQYLWPDLSVGEVCNVGLLSSQPCAKSCRKQGRIRDVKKNLMRCLGMHFSSTLPYSSFCVSILSFHWSQYSLDLCPCVFLVIYVQVCVKIYKYIKSAFF